MLTDWIPDLAAFWRAATLGIPIVIIGGGRWGRTWASVVADARGSGKGITMSARSDPEAVRAWAATQVNLAGMCIVSNLTEAMESRHPPAVAIVASRPRDHVRDVLEALRLGMHVLVEKPISVDAQSGRLLLTAAREAGRVLAVGTEFAYLPALHQLAGTIVKRKAEAVRFLLRWEDLAGEFRHGAVKTRHKEVSLLHDLLPHAFSIFQVFAPSNALHVVDANENPDKNNGWIKFGDDLGGSYELLCDANAAARRRVLELESGDIRAVLDFGGNTPSTDIDGWSLPLDPQLAAMSSTLRLELGAFLSVTTGAIDATFITSEIANLLALQEELERDCRP